jgi:DedD protein
MALFKIRWPGGSSRDDDKRGARQRRASPAESVDALRRRARHRLIGAAVLLVAGVVGFPLLFDTQPRPIPVDIPIAIPDMGQAPALVPPAPQVAAVAPAPAPAGAAPPNKPTAAPAPMVAKSAPSRASTADSLDRGEEVVASVPAKVERAEKPAAPPPVPKPQAKPVEPAHETHREVMAASKPAAPAPAPSPVAPAHADDDAARARALLEGKTLPAQSATGAAPPATAANAVAGRFIVQVGAFADAAKAQEARNKLTRSGLATYVQSVDTKDGKRLRVRVGPFANKAEADRAAAKVKGLDLPASILTL